jgi:hypothetical protein
MVLLDISAPESMICVMTTFAGVLDVIVGKHVSHSRVQSLFSARAVALNRFLVIGQERIVEIDIVDALIGTDPESIEQDVDGTLDATFLARQFRLVEWSNHEFVDLHLETVAFVAHIGECLSE